MNSIYVTNYSEICRPQVEGPFQDSTTLVPNSARLSVDTMRNTRSALTYVYKVFFARTLSVQIAPQVHDTHKAGSRRCRYVVYFWLPTGNPVRSGSFEILGAVRGAAVFFIIIISLKPRNHVSCSKSEIGTVPHDTCAARVSRQTLRWPGDSWRRGPPTPLFPLQSKLDSARSPPLCHLNVVYQPAFCPPSRSPSFPFSPSSSLSHSLSRSLDVCASPALVLPALRQDR